MDSTAGIQTRCSWSHVLMFGPPKLGLGEEALVHVTNFDWIDRTTDWRVLWLLSSTVQKRVQSEVEGKRRELSDNGTCTTWCRVLRFPKNNNLSSKNEAAWEEEKVYWTTFSGGSSCEKKKMKLRIKEAWRNLPLRCARAINSFTRSMTQKDSNRITQVSIEAGRCEKRKWKKSCAWNWPKESYCSNDRYYSSWAMKRSISRTINVWASKNLSKNHDEDLYYRWDRNWNLSRG